jgi:hypothetical protein
MHPDLLLELNELHIQDLHRGAARPRFTHPPKSLRWFRVRATASPATVAKNPREYVSHA